MQLSSKVQKFASVIPTLKTRITAKRWREDTKLFLGKVCGGGKGEIAVFKLSWCRKQGLHLK